MKLYKRNSFWLAVIIPFIFALFPMKVRAEAVLVPDEIRRLGDYKVEIYHINNYGDSSLMAPGTYRHLRMRKIYDLLGAEKITASIGGGFRQTCCEKRGEYANYDVFLEMDDVKDEPDVPHRREINFDPPMTGQHVVTNVIQFKPPIACAYCGGYPVIICNSDDVTIYKRLPVIMKQPSAAECEAGGKVKFSVEAVEAATYKWQKNVGGNYVNLEDGVGSNGCSILGSATATLSLDNLSVADSNTEYRCVMNTSDGYMNESAAALLTVNSPAVPTQNPSAVPTQNPPVTPTQNPPVPTAGPEVVPTDIPTVIPTTNPTQIPTQVPTVIPTQGPMVVPTQSPSVTPTQAPSGIPTSSPTTAPTKVPTQVPSVTPVQPKNETIVTPTVKPTAVPTTGPPSASSSSSKGTSEQKDKKEEKSSSSMSGSSGTIPVIPADDPKGRSKDPNKKDTTDGKKDDTNGKTSAQGGKDKGKPTGATSKQYQSSSSIDGVRRVTKDGVVYVCDEDKEYAGYIGKDGEYTESETVLMEDYYDEPGIVEGYSKSAVKGGSGLSKPVLYCIIAAGSLLGIAFIIFILFFGVIVEGECEDKDEVFDFCFVRIVYRKGGNWCINLSEAFEDNAVVRLRFGVLFSSLFKEWEIIGYSKGTYEGEVTELIIPKLLMYRRKIRRKL